VWCGSQQDNEEDPESVCLLLGDCVQECGIAKVPAKSGGVVRAYVEIETAVLGGSCEVGQRPGRMREARMVFKRCRRGG